MTTTQSDFSGSIPAIYDACLGPIFAEFAYDLGERVAAILGEVGQVLEVACGTGISTRLVRAHLPPHVGMVATDLNPAMIEFAVEERGGLPGVRYEIEDALNLSFSAKSFDAVICQFGIMFFPDIAKGLAEMLRVLRPGGLVACSVWDSLAANPAAASAHETIGRYFDSDPPTFLEVPFGSCPPEPTLELFRAQGFEQMHAQPVEIRVAHPSALELARGFIEGNPGIREIRERAKAPTEEIVEALATELEQHFGPDPLQIPMRAFVFTGHAPA